MLLHDDYVFAFSLAYSSSSSRVWKFQVSNKRAKLAAGSSILHWRAHAALHFWKEGPAINLHFWHAHCSSSPFPHRHHLYNSTQRSSSVSFIKSRRCPTSFPPPLTRAALHQCKQLNGWAALAAPGSRHLSLQPPPHVLHFHPDQSVLDASRILHHSDNTFSRLKIIFKRFIRNIIFSCPKLYGIATFVHKSGLFQKSIQTMWKEWIK